jgi:hypothetical protein
LKKSLITLAAAALLLPFTLTAQTAKQDMKDAGHDTADAAKTTGHNVKHGTKKATHKVAHKTKKGAAKVEDKTTPQ